MLKIKSKICKFAHAKIQLTMEQNGTGCHESHYVNSHPSIEIHLVLTGRNSHCWRPFCRFTMNVKPTLLRFIELDKHHHAPPVPLIILCSWHGALHAWLQGSLDLQSTVHFFGSERNPSDRPQGTKMRWWQFGIVISTLWEHFHGSDRKSFVW